MNQDKSINRRRVLGAAAAGAALSVFPAPFVRAQSQRRLVFWHNYTQKARVDFMRDCADRFERANPGVKIEIEVVPWGAFNQKWPAARAANALPDITTIEGQNAVPMAAAGALHPVDDVLRELGGPQSFRKNLVESSCKYNGAYISIPHYVHNRILIYRKDRLAEAGLPVPVTWDDALKAATALTKAPEYYGWILKLAKDDYGGSYLLWIMTRSAGGHFFDPDGNVTFDSEPVREATRFVAEIGRKASGPGIANLRVNDTFNLLSSGKQSMCEDTCATIATAAQQAPDVARNLEGTAMPRKTQVGNLVGCICLALPKGQNPEDARRFLAFLYAEENYMPFITTIPLFMFPAYERADTKSFFDSPMVAAYPNAVKATLDGIENGTMPGMDFGLNPIAAPILSSGLIEEMLQRIILANAAVDQEVATTARRMATLAKSIKARLGRG
jgi:multiple sugar transport system substrate-binding protein